MRNSTPMIDLSEAPYSSVFNPSKTKSNTIVIDNGTYELKAGFKNDLCIVVKNRIFKNKIKSKFDPFPSATKHSMFENDVICKFEILEMIIDNILKHLEPEPIQDLIFTVTPFSPTNGLLLDFLFNTYPFQRIKLGFDFIFAYNKYFKGENCLIISISYSNTFVCVVEEGKIKSLTKINFGCSDLIKYANSVMHARYKDFKQDYSRIVEHLRVSTNFEKEAVAIYNEICNGDYTHNLFLTDPLELVTSEQNVQILNNEIKTTDIPEIDYDVLELPDNQLDMHQLKSKRRMKLLFFSTLARLKVKIKKGLSNIAGIIENTKEEAEKTSDIERYIQIKKMKFEGLKRELKTRENLRKSSKNKNAREFVIKNKEGNLTDEEFEIKQLIMDAEDMDIEDELISHINALAVKIKALDPDFIPFYANTVEILKGDNIGRQCINIDLIRLPEIFFYPSIVKMPEMGISEILANLCDKFDIKNILLTGGMCEMCSLQERIYQEVKSRTKDVKIVVSGDAQSDPFYGSEIEGFGMTVKREEWKENGGEILAKEYDNMIRTNLKF